MAQRLIREYDAKAMLASNWNLYFDDTLIYSAEFAQIHPETKLDGLPRKYSWLTDKPLTIKPDMIIDNLENHNLVFSNQNWQSINKWLAEKRVQKVNLDGVCGTLSHFLIEPFVKPDTCYYFSIQSRADGDQILFSQRSSNQVEYELREDQMTVIEIPILKGLEGVDFEAAMPANLNPALTHPIIKLITSFYRYYINLNIAFFEVESFTINNNIFLPHNLKCWIDDVADFDSARKWRELSFPKVFGMQLLPEELYVNNIDQKSGASLKLTILNPKGKIWTMVAGGGASIVYMDTITDLGYVKELANYGEYSGDPSTDETYACAKTILDLMTREKLTDGSSKYLLIGGGIANFTDVVSTFTGVTKALKEYREKLIDTPVKIYVRRGGPNYRQGLKIIKQLGETLNLPISVYGPETHMTEIVNFALQDLQRESLNL